MNIEKGILLFILLLGAFLRFYQFDNLEFTHDELSAIGRLRFDSFNDLIRFGVKENDFHPAGVQVFLYLWSSIFGISELAIKFPFLIAGVGSIYLVYLVGKQWANSQVGLVSASFVSVLQYFIFYSQIARPYVLGMLFCLVMVYFMTRILKDSHCSKWMYIGFVIGATLSCYVHYFSFLTAIIIGFTGLVIMPRDRLKRFLISSVMVFLLFIPHISITLYQFGKGGVGGKDGWLGAPSNDFIIRYFDYLFHFNWFLICVFIVLLLLSFRNIKTFKLLASIGFVWFVLVFLIGFFYSKYVNPVLQMSLLIFTVPFLFISVFQGLKISMKNLVVVVFVISSIGVYSLAKREHFYLMAHQPFERFIEDSHAYLKENNITEYEAYFHSQPYFLEYYNSSYKLKYHVYYDTTILPKNFNPQSEYLIMGDMPMNLLSKAMGDFTIDSVYYGFNYETFFLHKGVGEHNLPSYFKSHISVNDLMDSSQEWGTVYEYKLDTIMHSRYDFIRLNMNTHVMDSFPSEGLLVAELYHKGERINWMSAPIQEFFYAGQRSGDVSIMFRIINEYHSKMVQDVDLKVYFWNKSRSIIKLENLNVECFQGNKYKYGLYEDF